MQESVASSSTGTAASFASLLAALTAQKPEGTDKPGARPSRKAGAWNDDELADDVATLSYEKALRTHARYRPAEATLPPAGAGTRWERKSAKAAGKGRLRTRTVPQESRKSASVTIRMSCAERDQLHARAAEAGLTISAYLRSCTFEAEALRAQVKETLAELKQARLAEANEAKKPVEREAPAAASWRAKLFPRWAHARPAEA